MDDPGSAQPLALTIGSPMASSMSDTRPSAISRGQATEVDPSASIVDAGLCMGRSFRVGWGPGGMLVVPGPHAASVGGAPQPLFLTRVKVEGSGGAYDEEDDGEDEAMGAGGLMDGAPACTAPARLAALRQRLRACLEVHVRHSAPVPCAEPEPSEASESESVRVPQWRLQCSAEEVGDLVGQLAAAAERIQASGGAGEEEEGRVAHEADTWRLLQVLYEHITPAVPEPALDVTGDQDMGGDDDGGASVGALSFATSIAPGAQGAPLLVAFERQAAVSRWLQKQAVPRVERALETVSSAPEAVLQLLSGRQLLGAAAVAAAAGDTRLATLISSAGQHAQAQAELARQLSVWTTSDMTPHIDSDRLLVYKLLAGQVLEANARLQLDWRRFLGLMVWYYNPATTASDASNAAQASVRHQAGHVASAIRAYAAMLEEKAGSSSSSSATVPLPLPHYAEDELGGALGTASGGAVDLQFALLQLWAADQEQQQELGRSGEAPPPQPPFAALLAASGHSANPCDGWVTWALATVLQALGALQAAGEAGQPAATAELLLSAHLALISQLLLAGGLSELAVYVALHLPDLAPGQEGSGGAGRTLRETVVAEVLAKTAPEWAGDSRKIAFLRDTLQLPLVGADISEGCAGGV